MAGLADIQAAQRPANYDIGYSRGDSMAVQFQVRDGRYRPVDITGLTTTAVATPAWGHPTTWPLVVTVDDAATGLLTVSWDVPTGVLLPTQGVWSLTLAGAGWSKTLVTGAILESRAGTVVCGCPGEAKPCQCS